MTMSVAQVLHLSGTPETAPPEVQDVLAALKAMDGFEHLYTLRNGDGESLGIQVWRDKVALEAAIASRASRLANMNITVTPGEIYDTFTEL
jgi:hypothetical protein